MRRRYVYRDDGQGGVKAVEVGADFQQHAERQPLFTDRYMEGTASPVDGSDIGSRTKRREHMKVHGLADADDFKGAWAKAEEKREAFLRGDGPGMRAALERALYEQERGKR